MKDSVSKMIEECKEMDSLKIIYADLYKSMNLNAGDSWKKPFA